MKYDHCEISSGYLKVWTEGAVVTVPGVATQVEYWKVLLLIPVGLAVETRQLPHRELQQKQLLAAENLLRSRQLPHRELEQKQLSAALEPVISHRTCHLL